MVMIALWLLFRSTMCRWKYTRFIMSSISHRAVEYLPKRLVTFSPEVDLNDSALLDSTSFRKKFCKGTEKDWLVFRTEENVELRSLDLELLRSLRNVTFFFEYEKHHLRP